MVGCYCAYELTSHGLKTVLFERGEKCLRGLWTAVDCEKNTVSLLGDCPTSK
jgi:2-polyprenyl-6-methoxyphenol hydroxylase-like FAD-dependent oxidoreductase